MIDTIPDTQIQVSSKLKFQSWIERYKIQDSCPIDTKEPNNQVAFRLAHSPITSKLNFLPNVVYDRIIKNPYNYNRAKPADICSRCGASFFTTRKKALSTWKGFSQTVKENLCYTHLAQGVLNGNDGVMKEPKNEHFGFYQHENIDLSNSFSILETLP